MKTNTILIALAISTFAIPVALAKPTHHHHRVVAAPQAVYSGNPDGDVVARATERAQHEPGVTNEFAPDARQTATGGPVGGVPGYEGGL